ncbi:hypothetical protein SK128_022576, partial [Halocaridina rubra]
EFDPPVNKQTPENIDSQLCSVTSERNRNCPSRAQRIPLTHPMDPPIKTSEPITLASHPRTSQGRLPPECLRDKVARVVGSDPTQKWDKIQRKKSGVPCV